MAISPNTTFVSGAVYTAQQANAYGFSIVALGTSTTSSSAVSVETLSVTSNSFTAIANRNYKITYYEPQVTTPSTLSGFTTIRLYENSVATELW